MSLVFSPKAVKDTFRYSDCSLWSFNALIVFLLVFKWLFLCFVIIAAFHVWDPAISHSVLTVLPWCNQEVAEKQILLSLGSIQFNHISCWQKCGSAWDLVISPWLEHFHYWCYRCRTTVHTVGAPWNHINLQRLWRVLLFQAHTRPQHFRSACDRHLNSSKPMTVSLSASTMRQPNWVDERSSYRTSVLHNRKGHVLPCSHTQHLELASRVKLCVI